MSNSNQFQISDYDHLIALNTPFTAPPLPSGPEAAAALDTALAYLGRTPHPGHNRGRTDHLLSLELSQKVRIFHQLLTVRPARPRLPETVIGDVEAVIRYHAQKKPLTNISSIRTLAEILQVEAADPWLKKLTLWRGDITTLEGVTAIVNAANEEMLGCFTPGHTCIDNVIHAAAGPRLRDDCETIIDAQGALEQVGKAKVTRGYLLPAKYVVHTVGPQVMKRLNGEKTVRDFERDELENCYWSCLEAMEELREEGRGKTVAFCCVSTGLYGYPPDEAVHAAVETVIDYFDKHPNSSVEKVVFNVFTANDFSLYIDKFNTLLPSPITTSLTPADFTIPTTPNSALTLATTWLSSSRSLLLTAGAGLSASDGLDYTSSSLFSKHFPGMWSRNFTCLYDLFGHDFDSPAEKWGYYFSHLIFVRSWASPVDSVYTKLKTLVDSHKKNYFIRTSNADGLFLRHGFDKDRIATPQGCYELLQCMKRCRPDAVWEVQPFIDAAMPYLDIERCMLREDIDCWEDAVPECKYCGGDMFLCVRGGGWFNEAPFQEAEGRYRQWVEREATEEDLVVLEIGAGFNTPAVIRWPDEKLVGKGKGRVKLIRVGMKGGEMVDWEREGVDMVGIEGDAGVVVGKLLEGLGLLKGGV